MPSKVDNAGVAHAALIQRRKIAREDDWVLAKLLYNIRRYELWRLATGGVDTWEDYLKQPEIGISKHKADKLIRIYDYFITSGYYTVEELAGVPWYALDYVAKRKSGRHRELLEASKHLTQKDFKEHYFDVEEGGDRTYTFVVMKKCDQTGNLEKVHGIESEFIKEKLGL